MMENNSSPTTVPASQQTAGTAKPTIQVQVRLDQDAAFLRGEVVGDFGVVDLDISSLTTDQRAQLLKHKGYDGQFKIGDKMDQPTTEMLIALLQSKVDSAKHAKEEEAARALKTAEEYATKVDETIAKCSVKIPATINQKLEVWRYSENGYQIEAYPTWDMSVYRYGSATEEAKQVADKAEAKLKEAIALLSAENADTVKEHTDKVSEFYAKQEEAKRIAEEKARYEAEKAAQEENAERLKTGRYTHYFGDYNERRYGRPWGATVRLVNGKLDYNFNNGSYANNHVTIPCKPGEIVACGQKDNRGSGTENYLFVMEEDGSMRKIERGEARELLQNPIPKGYLAKPEEFADA
jgi:hypothetical protein